MFAPKRLSLILHRVALVEHLLAGDDARAATSDNGHPPLPPVASAVGRKFPGERPVPASSEPNHPNHQRDEIGRDVDVAQANVLVEEERGGRQGGKGQGNGDPEGIPEASGGVNVELQ